MQLKWNQGLASRGKLKGKQTFGDVTAVVETALPVANIPVRWADPNVMGRVKSLKRKREASQVVDNHKRKNAKQHTDSVAIVLSELPRLQSSPRPPVPQILFKEENARLFDHYLNHVAKVTVVSNSSKNPFKTIICPMSFESPLIMSNILAIAAANLSNTIPDYEFIAYHHLNNAYAELKERLSNPKLALTEITLAGVLGQVSCQLHFGELSQWRVHLTAARGIVNALGGPQAVLAKHPNFRFYIQHLAWLDTLAATTSSTKQIGKSDYWKALLQSIQGESSSYGMRELMGCPENLLELIAEMTQRFDEELFADDIDLDADICDKIVEIVEDQDGELNKRETLTRQQLGAEFEAKLEDLKPASPPEDSAGALYEIFRITAKIYLTYRIMHSTCWTASLQVLLRQAIQLLEMIPSKSSEEMALPWPLFIMGSICVYAREQKIIRARYAVMTKYMGFGNIHRCMELLEEVWAGWKEAEVRSCPSRIAGQPWDERELGRKRWEVSRVLSNHAHEANVYRMSCSKRAMICFLREATVYTCREMSATARRAESQSSVQVFKFLLFLVHLYLINDVCGLHINSIATKIFYSVESCIVYKHRSRLVTTIQDAV